MWEERGGYAQRPGERRHTGPHHRHDLVHPGPYQLYRIGARRGGLLPAVILKLTQIYLPPPADSNEVSLIWPLYLPHTHAGMYIHTHRHTHAVHTHRIPSDCSSSSSTNTSSFAYKLLALEHQAWHPSRVHWPADSKRDDWQAWPSYGSSTKTFFSWSSEKKKKRLAHSTGTGTPQEQTILTEDFGSFQGLSVTFSRPLKKMVFEASQWRQLIGQGFFKDSKLYRVEWLRIQLNNRLHTDVEGTLCTSASVIKSWEVNESHIEPAVLCAILF